MNPGAILLSLIGAAIAFSGWGYAWKQDSRAIQSTPVAIDPVGSVNTPFSDQEDIMFSLQDQIEILELENRDLRAQLESLRNAEPATLSAPPE